jgi:peptide/nickel transport system substrate-binding protein
MGARSVAGVLVFIDEGVVRVSEQQEFKKLLDGALSGRFSRRQVMTRAAALGMTAATVSTLGMAAKAAPGISSAKYIPNAQDATPVPVSGGTLKVGLQADPTALDPQTQSLTAIWHVVEHIYDTIVEVDSSLAPIPSLAASWDISADGTEYTFHLQPGVLFHDGSALKASDVVFTFTRILDPVTASTSTSNLIGVVGAAEFNGGTADTVTGLAAPDDATVVITLKAPDASFLTVLADISMVIYSQAFVEANNNDVSQVAMGTGPFAFKEYIPNTSVSLEKFADHWREGLPYLDAIEMIIAPEDTARTTSLIQGATDFIEYAPLRDIGGSLNEDDFTLAGNSNTNIRFIIFNLDVEPFNNPLVRQAIAKVVDREPMMQAAIFGQGTPVVTLFPPDFWAVIPAQVEAPDIEGAKALLAEAGFADGFKTKITSWSQYSFLSAAATVLQEQLKTIGIDAELNLVENATMIADVHVPASKNFEIGVTGTSAYVDPGPLIQSNFGTGQDSNTSGYTNTEVDGWIAAAAIETDQAARATLYQQVQTQLLADLPWVNLFVANQYEAMKQNVKGYVHIPTGSNHYLRETWLDES